MSPLFKPGQTADILEQSGVQTGSGSPVVGSTPGSGGDGFLLVEAGPGFILLENGNKIQQE